MILLVKFVNIYLSIKYHDKYIYIYIEIKI